MTHLDTDQAMQLALRYHQAAQLSEAGTLYRKILAARPEHAGARSSLGMVHYSLGDTATALELVVGATERSPEVAGFWLNRGAVERAAGQTDAARGAHETAIARDPELADAYYNLCDLHLACGRPEAAVAVCAQRLDGTPFDWRALAFQAHALEAAGDMQRADRLLNHRQFRRQLHLEPPPGHPNLHAFNRALAHHILAHPTLVRDPPGRSTRNGFHTGELLSGRLGPMKTFRRMLRSAIERYQRSLPDDPGHPLIASSPRAFELTSWALVLESGGHEVAHIHPEGWLSGVYYVSLPTGMGPDDPTQAGWLEFGRPTAELATPAAPRLHQVPPVEGRLYLFPAYFYHGTIPFESEQRRICISFDVRAKSTRR